MNNPIPDFAARVAYEATRPPHNVREDVVSHLAGVPVKYRTETVQDGADCIITVSTVPPRFHYDPERGVLIVTAPPLDW